MEHLRVYQSPYPKIRLGNNNDGGYVICDLSANYDVFLSGGIGNDISFEEAFLQKYTDVICYAFDGTIKNFPKPASNRLFYSNKNLGSHETLTTTNMKYFFGKYQNIFMKIDIEGGEDNLFQSISNNDLLKIRQLVIEFHTAEQIVIPTRLAKTHWLVHFHANNCCGLQKLNNIFIPNVFECTYIRKEVNENLSYNIDPIPFTLDQPNLKNRVDITIDWPPFRESAELKNCGLRDTISRDKSNLTGAFYR
jgi:hypothetical protein